jgi:hypothetical protein
VFYVLLVIIGIAAIVMGVRRAVGGAQAPLRGGRYKAAVQAWATGLLIALAGFVVTVYGLTAGSVLAAVGGLVVGGGVTALGGRKLFNDMQRQVSGG